MRNCATEGETARGENKTEANTANREIEDPEPHESDSANGACIVVIDDDRLVRETLSEVLKNFGYRTLQAGDGEEGMALCRACNVDLVITDIVMPNRDGIETILAVKHEFPDMKILAISGSGLLGDSDYLTFARMVGASHTLRKPFRMRELLEAVSLCLAT